MSWERSSVNGRGLRCDVFTFDAILAVDRRQSGPWIYQKPTSVIFGVNRLKQVLLKDSWLLVWSAPCFPDG